MGLKATNRGTERLLSCGPVAPVGQLLTPVRRIHPHTKHHGCGCSTLHITLARLAAAAQPSDHGVVGLHHLQSHSAAQKSAGKATKHIGRRVALPAAPAASIKAKKSRPQMAGSTSLMVSQLPRLEGASVIDAGTAPERTWSAPRQAWRPAQRRIAPLCRSPLKPPHHPVH